MSIAPEGSRVIREGIIVSVPMNWCKSPDCIVPYKIYTHHQVEGANNADSVRQTDAVSHVKESLILKCYGDEPGVGGGCNSGTHIGPSWNQPGGQSRKEQLREYASEMAQKKCPMQVILSLCGDMAA